MDAVGPYGQCPQCLKDFRANSIVAFVYKDDNVPHKKLHWDCCAGHDDDTILAVLKGGIQSDLFPLHRLSRRQQGAAKGLAKKLKKGRIKGSSRLSGMGGSAFYG